ncbi:MAG: YfiR family protein [Pseudomonadota bacterium]
MSFIHAIKQRWRHRYAALRRGCVMALSTLMAVTPSSLQAQSMGADNPDAVEAAFLYNFAKFTTWPSISDLDTSIKFCVQRETIDPAVFAGWGKKRIHNRPVRVLFFDSIDDASVFDCSIMFLGDIADGTDLGALFQRATENSTLLVSDMGGFGSSGGHIELFIVNRRLRFKVNLDELSKAQLSLGAGVLNLAEIVETEGSDQ